MKLNSYSIFDNQAKQYNNPMLLANDAVAIRQIRNELLNPNSQLSLSPQDFSIVKNGEYDTETGLYSNTEKLEIVVNVNEIELPQIKEVK